MNEVRLWASVVFLLQAGMCSPSQSHALSPSGSGAAEKHGLGLNCWHSDVPAEPRSLTDDPVGQARPKRTYQCGEKQTLPTLLEDHWPFARKHSLADIIAENVSPDTSPPKRKKDGERQNSCVTDYLNVAVSEAGIFIGQ